MHPTSPVLAVPPSQPRRLLSTFLKRSEFSVELDSVNPSNHSCVFSLERLFPSPQIQLGPQIFLVCFQVSSLSSMAFSSSEGLYRLPRSSLRSTDRTPVPSSWRAGPPRGLSSRVVSAPPAGPSLQKIRDAEKSGLAPRCHRSGGHPPRTTDDVATWGSQALLAAWVQTGVGAEPGLDSPPLHQWSSVLPV